MKRKRTARELSATAYHEAGHAVAHFTKKRRIVKVSIIAGEDSYGHVLSIQPAWIGNEPNSGITPRQRNELETRIICALAGLAAQVAFQGHRRGLGAKDDYHMAVYWASFVHCDQQVLGKYLAYLESVAKQLVTSPQNWPLIKRVAEELLTHRQLSGTEVVRIIRKAGNERCR